MSFVESAIEVLERSEASLLSLITDATKARAYGEIMTIAAMAQSVAAIGPGREGKRVPASEPAIGSAEPTTPSWMRRREP
jgi:hypothetical protein